MFEKNIISLRKENELIDLFCTLAEIPSPSLKEENVINWICNFCEKHNITYSQDDYKNIYISFPATDTTKESILLSSHLDVIGDGSPVITYLDEENDVIRAKDRTLGADDKAGVANALYFAKELQESKDINHGGLEILFTRDEENGMTGIKNADLKKINSKNVLVLDGDSLGQCMTSGASYVTVEIEVQTMKGGHSGNDIGDFTRENAAKLLADIVSELPQGVFYSDNGQVITSCNIGGIVSGDVNVTNIINTFGKVSYSIRSSNEESENHLIKIMKDAVDYYNKKYTSDIARFTMTVNKKMPMFVNSNTGIIPSVFEKSAMKLGIIPEISSFHAGAETHIYAQKTNAKGEKFSPYLLGLASVYNMHSAKEYLDYNSMIKGQKLLKELFIAYNEAQ